MKCDKCGYVSFDFNMTCPACSRDLSQTRAKLGISCAPPETTFDEFFSGASGIHRTVTTKAAAKGGDAELDLDSMGSEFEFTLDD